MNRLFPFLSLILILAACQPNLREYGSQHIQVFGDEPLNFNPELWRDTIDLESDGVVRLADGRIILRKLQLPVYQREVKALLRIKMRSGGDPWDKSGSCFVIPSGQLINLLSVASGAQSFPEPDPAHENFKGIAPGLDFWPTVELMRFMTPFGAITERTRNRRPVYIPHWEEEVVWEQDITDRLPLLEGEVWLGIWADTWTKEGYVFSAELILEESPYACARKTQRQVTPLINTVYYIGGQQHVDIFARQDLEVRATIPAQARNVKLYYTTTGHGGHAGGDEFVPKENIIQLNGEVVHRFIPWRDDCAAFRRFNPSSGVWLRQDTAYYLDPATRSYQHKVIEERIASSDLSRSNWCPGSMVAPQVISLSAWKQGENVFSFGIPEAQEARDPLLNHWLVAAWLVWEE